MADTTYIGLVGNPNCGKTTLFNEITGSNGYVGNWPGVTVEKLQAPWTKNKSVEIVDLPGIYSLSPYSPEEVVSRDYIVREMPSAVINIIDGTNLERSLYLTTQVAEAGRPMVVALNMCDLVASKGDSIDTKLLSEKLGVPVMECSALRNMHLDELISLAVEEGAKGSIPSGARCFGADVEEALSKIAALISDSCTPELERWYAIKAFERDLEAIEPLNLSKDVLAQIEQLVSELEVARDDDAESIITSDRYDWIEGVMEECVTKAPARLSTTERIDKVVTSRLLGIPIFILVMGLVYYLAIGTVGTAATDWVNDNLFGNGFFIGAGQDAYKEASEAWAENHYSDFVEGYLASAEESGVDMDALSEAVDEGDVSAFQGQLTSVVATDVPLLDADGNYLDTQEEVITELDASGEPILAAGQELLVEPRVDFASFSKAVSGLAQEPAPEDFGNFVPSIPGVVEGFLDSIGTSDMVKSLVIEGVVGGVGSVLGFIPQMLVLFVLLSFLEDCGYMARVAFVMDRVFRRFGLSGKSFIPMLISSGCGVPGVLATKTIENENDRRMTAMLTTMVPCGAKLPIIALVMGVLIGGSDAWWVGPMFYFLGVFAIIISAIMLKKTKWFAGEPAPFVMELPEYHLPALKSWWLHVWERISEYVAKAGTIIFAAAVGIWVLSRFGFAGWEGGSGGFGYLEGMAGAPEEYMDYSLLAAVSRLIGWIFAPLGCGYWQATASSISALIAKENLVGTFGALWGLGEATENSVSMWNGFAGLFTDNAGLLHVGAMCAYVAFNMLDAPCFAAIGTIRKQMNSRFWFWFAIVYQCVFGWAVGLIINQLWELVVLGNFGVWTIVAFVLLAAMLFQIFRPMPEYEKSEARVAESLA